MVAPDRFISEANQWRKKPKLYQQVRILYILNINNKPFGW